MRCPDCPNGCGQLGVRVESSVLFCDECAYEWFPGPGRSSR